MAYVVHSMLKATRTIFLITLTLGLLLVSTKVNSGLTDPKLKWYTLSTPHFNIHYHEGEEDIAYRLAPIAERVHQDLSSRFKWKPWGRTEVVLSDTTDYSNGLATPIPYNGIVLLISTPPGDFQINYYDDWLEDLFIHEYTHIIHVDMYGGIAKPFRWILGRLVAPNGLTPGWVREGIAVQQESRRGKGRVHNSFSNMMLRADILNDQFLSLDQMAGLGFKWPAGRAPYIYGGSFWAYLAEKYGEDKIVEFSHRYSDSMWLFSLNNKARKTFKNKNFFKLHREWKAHLRDKFQKQKLELEGKGLTPLKDLLHFEGNLEHPTLSPDGKSLLYTKTDVHNDPEIRLRRLDGSEDQRLLKGTIANQFSFSPDGKKVVYSSIARHKHYYRYYDLYELDLNTKKAKKLTKGKRAFHPDYSLDGKKRHPE